MKKCLVGLAMSCVCLSAFADGYWSTNIQGGLSLNSLSNTERVAESQYATSDSNSVGGLFGLGLAYNIPVNAWVMSMGLTGYYLPDVQVKGVKTPPAGLDPVNYTATGQSFGLLFEPKILWAEYAFQPYFIAGFGLGINDFGNYSETPQFNSETQTNLAYEFGLGVQYVLNQTPNSPIIALDYRYMNWGDAGLAAASGQSTNNGLSFGSLSSNTFNLSLILPF